jgi:hypothetical protein
MRTQEHLITLDYLPSSSLRQLASKYVRPGDVPAGEAFQAAFSRFLKANRESLFDIAVAAASAQISVVDGPDDVDPLLLKSIHDTNPTLSEAHLFALSGDDLQGAVNTAKGKYFEYLVAAKLNHGEQVGPLLLEPGQHAVLADAMNQPGWDLRIIDNDGAVVDYLQLKATHSVGYVRAALERYPDIQILGTSEVAHSGLVMDSGLSDHDLQAHVGHAVAAVDGSLTESFLDHFHPLLPFATMAIYEGYRLAIGRQSLDNFKMALARRGQRTVATQLIGATVYALGGGYLSLPVAIAGGLVFDRTVNQAALTNSYKAHRDNLLSLRLLQQERELAKEFQ